MLELEPLLQQEVAELLALSKQAEVGDLPVNMDVHEELILRRTRLANLAQAKKVLELRATERYQAEQAEYEAKIQAREARAHGEPQTAWASAPTPTTARATRQGSIQLHRSRFADHEEQHR